MKYLLLTIFFFFSTTAHAAASLVQANFNDIIWPGTSPSATGDEFESAGILFTRTGPGINELLIIADADSCCEPGAVVGDGTRYLAVAKGDGPFEITITNPNEGYETFGLLSFEFATLFGQNADDEKLVITGYYSDGRPPISKEVLYDAVPESFQLVDLEPVWADIDSIKMVSEDVFPAFDNFLFSLTTPGPIAPTDVILDLEEPVNGQIHSGIGNLRGWAISPEGIDRVEIYIDGQYAFDAPYGGDRPDVGEAYPNVEGAENSGYSLAFGYSNLSDGEHTIKARAVDLNGDFPEDTSTFTVVSFDETFIFSNEIVDVSDSTISAAGDEIFLEDVTVGEKVYDLKLKWRTAEQGFEIIEIR